jgi:hypothetical protein
VHDLRPRRQLRPDLERAHHRLQRIEQRRDGDEAEQDPVRALPTPGDQPGGRQQDADDHRDIPVERVRDGQQLRPGRHGTERRDDHAAHQRPVREDERGVARRDIAAEEQDRVGRHRRERGQQREALAGAAAGHPRRIAGPDEQECQDADDDERRGEVGGDRRSRVAEANRLLPQPRLEPDERHRPDRREHQGRAVTVVEHREHRDAQDEKADHGRDQAVDPLGPRLEVAQRGHDLAVTEGPVRAAHAAVGRADHDPDDDEPERGRQGQSDELLVPGHQTSAGHPPADRWPRGRARTPADCSVTRAGRLSPASAAGAASFGAEA